MERVVNTVQVQKTSGSSVADGHVNILTFLCQKLDISSTVLLSEDVQSHAEFMRALSSVSASAKTYFTLRSTWDSIKSFTKSGSILSQKLHYAGTRVSDLKRGLLQLSELKVITGNLSVQLKSSQDKLNKMLFLLPVLFQSKEAMEDAVTNLQASVRAQKARKFNNKTGHGDYTLVSGNSLTLSWDKAEENIAEMEASDFSPLTLTQVRAFPSIKDICHRQGMDAIPAFVIQEQFQLTDDKVKDAVCQLVELFPLLLIQKGDNRVLLDFVELVFRPDIVHEVLNLDLKKTATDDCSASTSTTEASSSDGILFFKKTGPVPLQQKFPEIFKVMMDFVQLNGMWSSAAGYSGSCTSTCGWFDINFKDKDLLSD